MSEPENEAEQAAEKRGYAKGYAVGKRRLASDMTREELAAEREAWRRQVFLAALPMALTQNGWKRGESPIASVKDRVRFAAEIADEALNRL